MKLLAADSVMSTERDIDIPECFSIMSRKRKNQTWSEDKAQPKKGIKGILEPFCELERRHRLVAQDEKHIFARRQQWSYDGLNCLNDGDF